MKNFLKNKRMWGYVDGKLSLPQDAQSGKYAQELETWEVNNSKNYYLD